MGISHFLQRFTSESGQAFLAAAEYLNCKNYDVSRSAASSRLHVTNFWTFVFEEMERDHAAAIELISAASRLLIFAASTIEVSSMAQNAKHWASGMSNTQTEAVNQWRRDPDNWNLFIAATQSAFEQRLAEERNSAHWGSPAPPRRWYSAGRPSFDSVSATQRDAYGNA
eukprot:1899605-Karenia_brevis.AAC.1